MASRVCGVCQNAESKYKCPVCELRYCSAICFKQHKPQHLDGAFPSHQTSHTEPVARPRDRPGTKFRAPKVSFANFENDPEFRRLLSRYPLLKIQLQSIYALTLEPGPGEERSWSRRPLYGDVVFPAYASRGRGRGRFMSRGSRGRGHPPAHAHTQARNNAAPDEDRARGQWTREKGDKEALTTIKRMRGGADDDARAEGMREFIELCQMRFGENASAGQLDSAGNG